MSTVLAKALFPLLLLSGGTTALAGCSTSEAPTAMAHPNAMAEYNNTGEPAGTTRSGTTENPCADVIKVSPRANGLGGHQMPPACDEYLEQHPNIPSSEAGTK